MIISFFFSYKKKIFKKIFFFATQNKNDGLNQFVEEFSVYSIDDYEKLDNLLNEKCVLDLDLDFFVKNIKGHRELLLDDARRFFEIIFKKR